MKDDKFKKKMFKLIKGIVLSELLAFVLYAVSAPFLSSMLYGRTDERTEEDLKFTAVYFIMFVIYIVANYIIYIRKAFDEEHLGGNGPFALVDDLKMYISGDGRYLLIAYGVLAVVTELLMLIGGPSAATLFVFIFPLIGVINVPVLRTVVSYVLLMVLMFAVIEWKRSRIYKYWNER